MPRRRLVAVLVAALSLALAPAAARATEVAPHRVVVGVDGAAAQPQPKVVHVRDVPTAVRSLRDRPGVAYAVPDVVAHASAFQVPNDRGQGNGWQAVQWNFLSGFGVDAVDAWRHVYDAGRPGGRGVTIAVLDTGVASATRGRFRQSPDLAGTRFAPGYDFVDRDRFAQDENGHGTFVASELAETTDNGIALTGLAYGARIMPIRVLARDGSGYASTIALGVRYAVQHGAKIVNLSLEFDPSTTARQIPELIDAIAYAHRHGVLVVASSGNYAVRSVAYPARARYVLSVGATTQHGCLADYSNDGRGLDLVAPGGGADAELAGDANCHPFDSPGPDIFQMTFVGSSVRRFGLPSGYEGTSMAAPHVSATAALVVASGVLGANPSPDQLARRLERTSRDLGASGYDRHYGWGLVDAGAATDPSVSALAARR